MAATEAITIESSRGACRPACVADIAFVRHFDRRNEDIWRRAIAGTLNRGHCRACGAMVDADRPFLYCDLNCALAVVVRPADDDGTQEPDWRGLDEGIVHIGNVRGLDRFREMLLMHEHGVGPTALEEFKQHLAVTRGGQAGDRLIWTAVADGKVVLRAITDGGALSSEEVRAPLWRLGAVGADLSDARQALGSRRSRRRRFIGASEPRISNRLFATEAVGGALPDGGAAELARLFETDDGADRVAETMAQYVRQSPERFAEAGQLFEDATGISLSADLTARLGEVDSHGVPAIETLWRSFGQLPAPLRKRSVLSLEEIDIDQGIKGEAAVYVPDDSAADVDRIDLSFGIIQGADFPHALRHELAHAIHDRCAAQVDGWLDETFGWRWHPLPRSWSAAPEMLRAAVDAWIGELGGWALAAPGAVSEEQRTAHCQMIWTACQLGASAPPDMESHLSAGPFEQAAWFGDSYAKRVHEAAPQNWWRHAANWFAIPTAPGRLAMMNYKYRELVTLDASARALVADDILWNDFALMSHREFFAEFYATWHDPDTKLRAKFPAFGQFLSELHPG